MLNKANLTLVRDPATNKISFIKSTAIEPKSQGSAVTESNKYIANSNGYYGEKCSSSSIRNLVGGETDAKNMFNQLSKGYISEVTIGKNGGIVRTLPDGTTITYRAVSVSDGTPAIDIAHSTIFKNQKIHFVN